MPKENFCGQTQQQAIVYSH